MGNPSGSIFVVHIGCADSLIHIGCADLNLRTKSNAYFHRLISSDK